MKILVLGARGQLGSAFINAKSEHEIVSQKNAIDICDTHSLRIAIGQTQPEVIINCAAYTSVDKAEKTPGACFAVNARGVHNVATLCAEKNIQMIQISTDYVFPGNAHQWPYKENSQVGPLQTYGVSKLASEVITKNIATNFKIFRTSALFGPVSNRSKGTFIKTALDRLLNGEIVEVYDHQRISVGYTPHIALAILNTLTTQTNAVYHVINEGVTSWYNFIRVAASKFPNSEDLLARLKIQQLKNFPKEFRPQYSALKNCYLPLLPHYEKALDEYLQISYQKVLT